MARLRAAVLLLRLLCFSSIFANLQAYTHWVVTENGMITQQLESNYNLRKPFDLLAFVRQEELSKTVQTLEQELLIEGKRINEGERAEEKNLDIEQQIFHSDHHCIAAGKELANFDLYTSTVVPLDNKNINFNNYINLKVAAPKNKRSPNCTEVANLAFSIYAFEHLPAMLDRRNLTDSPEPGLQSALNFGQDIDKIGHAIYTQLHKNATSWILYDLAAFYWRIKGNSLEMVECSRRALHLSPRFAQDISLINLANVFHRSGHSADAAILIQAALEISNGHNVNQFTLGNIYAVLGEYNLSAYWYEETILRQPDFGAALERKHSVLCQQKIEEAMDSQRMVLQKTLQELQEYQEKHEVFQEKSKKMLDIRESRETQYDSNVLFQNYKLQESLRGVSAFPPNVQYCLLKDSGSKPECTKLGGSGQYNKNAHVFGSVHQDQVIEALDAETSQETMAILLRPPTESNWSLTGGGAFAWTDPLQPGVSIPPQKANPNSVYRQPDWPSLADCQAQYKGVPKWSDYQSTYLPAAYKGFSVKQLLSRKIDLAFGDEHPLPWVPPICVNMDPSVDPLGEGEPAQMAVDQVEGVANRASIPIKLPDPYMKHILLDLVDIPDGEYIREEEIGQRILTSLQKNEEWRWILFNLAGLYWRVVGNSYHGVECLRRAVHLAPPDFADVPLVNLANIMHKAQRHQDAETLLRMALDVEPNEAITHFALGVVLAAQENYTGAVDALMLALDLNPEYRLPLHALHTIRCHQKMFCSPSSGPVVLQVAGAPDQSPICHQHLQQRIAHIVEQQHHQPGGRKGAGSPQCQGGQVETILTPSSETERRVVCIDGTERCQVQTRQRKLLMGEEPGSNCAQPSLKSNESQDQRPAANGKAENDGDGKSPGTASTGKPKDPPAKKPGQAQSTLDVKPPKKSTTVVKEKRKSYFLRKTTYKRYLEPDSAPVALGTPQPLPDTIEEMRQLMEGLATEWPRMQQCVAISRVDLKDFTSSWLAFTAKDIRVERYVDFQGELGPRADRLLPVCDQKLPPSAHTMDHLRALAEKDQLDYHYEQETGLGHILSAISGKVLPHEELAHRTAIALIKDPTNYVAANLAALYWRVVGDGRHAINCLRQALQYSPHNMKDIALIGLANVLLRAVHYEDAVVAAYMAAQISPHLVVNHLTLADAYAAIEEYVKALQYYQTTVRLQPDFLPAAQRLHTVKCQFAIHYEKMKLAAATATPPRQQQ